MDWWNFSCIWLVKLVWIWT